MIDKIANRALMLGELLKIDTETIMRMLIGNNNYISEGNLPF
ncbi:MAG: hypothetical protein PHX62_02090 [Bacilli bacterium]|nr:hypothetical protein [Bacilli bacterium]